jgi:hypothetical protein
MNKKRLILITLVLFLLFIAGTALAASNDYAITWWTVDGGGGVSQGGDYTLQGTIGQPDTGSSQGGEYSLVGGFWAGIVDWVGQFLIHLPVVFR